jgi:hypothetical protein
MCGGAAGPRRADVVFECGLGNQVLSVEEPATCYYRCVCVCVRGREMESEREGGREGRASERARASERESERE